MRKPTAEDLATYEAEALAWCNKRRAERGAQAITHLPKGYQQDSKYCPCANATKTVVSTYWWEWLDIWMQFGYMGEQLSCSVARFVELFDRGYYPHLIEQSDDR